MNKTILFFIVFANIIISFVFASPADIETYYIQNNTEEVLVLSMEYYDEFVFIYNRASIIFRDEKGNVLERNSVLNQLSGNYIEIFPGKKKVLFQHFKDAITTAMTPLTKFLQIVKRFEIKNKSGEILLAQDSLTNQHFSEWGVSVRDNSWSVIITSQKKMK